MVQPHRAAPNFCVIKTKEMEPLVAHFHYSRRLNTNEIISFGIRNDAGVLIAAALISPTKYREPVVALGRLVRAPDCDVPMSQFISWCCDQLRARGHHIVIAFADWTHGHHGGVYQASGWHYDGQKRPANDGLVIDGVFCPGRTLNLRFGTRSAAKLKQLAKVLSKIPNGYTEDRAAAWISARGFLVPRDGVLDAARKISSVSSVEPHFDAGKYLYWRALTDAGKTEAIRLDLKSLPYPRPRGDVPAKVVRRTKSRFASRPLNGQSASLPAHDHPAIMSGRTIFPGTVRPARSSDRWALKRGEHSRKIGDEILKSKWKGFPVWTLTLEERATCPQSCHHWRSCMGNKMNHADRVQAGADLEWRLEREVALLDIDHPNGFCIRLHALGDFYSVRYVELWRKLLARHPALHVWGYSARHDKGDPVAAALASLARDAGWDRFAMRFSNALSETRSTISVEHPYQVPPDAILCPEQIGRTESCSTCGLCWQSERRIAFLQH